MMLQNGTLRRHCITLVLLAFGVLLGAASAQTESVLYNFCSVGCSDGSLPYAGLVFDKKGNLFGTTKGGGTYNGGTVFKLTPRGQESVLYSFCPQSQNDCPDGEQPIAGVILDQQGNLYGTTPQGGEYLGGVIFKITPQGNETVLYTFGGNDGIDGYGPGAGVVFDKQGNLYGTTSSGGQYGNGVVFKLAPNGGQYTVLYNFCQSYECPDGSGPSAGVVFHRGNLYGTTRSGGKYAQGTVFKLTLGGQETVLYNFCEKSGCPDGRLPRSGVVFDKQGNLYGTVWQGGNTTQNCSDGCGLVFMLTPKGKETVLHTFCAQSGCADGAVPIAGLVLEKGNLYGTTSEGGADIQGCNGVGCGVVFKVTTKGQESVLYSFCSQENCSDGATPYAPVLFDHTGNLYGTTNVGGGNPVHAGVVFEVKP